MALLHNGCHLVMLLLCFFQMLSEFELFFISRFVNNNSLGLCGFVYDDSFLCKFVVWAMDNNHSSSCALFVNHANDCVKNNNTKDG